MAAHVLADGALAGQVAVVTGGGTGLGLAAARELVAAGCRVVVAGRRAEVLESAVASLGGGSTAVAVAADLRSEEGAEAVVEAALGRFGRVDVLVNNAGGQYFVPAEAITAKGWRAVHRLNVGVTVRMSELVAERAMRPQGGGTILNVTLSPHHGLAGMTHSSAARAAVEGITREHARAWAGDGIAVVALAAGHFETDAIAKYPEPVKRGAALTVPLGRLGRPEEHGWLVSVCATPIGRALSGSVVTLDGGRDNWYGPWPPASLTEDGEVPTEARRPAGPAPSG